MDSVLVRCVLVAQSCLTLSDPMDCRPPGSSVHGILQARKLEWVAILFSRGSSWPRDWSPTLQADSLPCEPPGKPPVVRSVIPYFLQNCRMEGICQYVIKIFKKKKSLMFILIALFILLPRNFSKNSYSVFSITALFIYIYIFFKNKTSIWLLMWS